MGHGTIKASNGLTKQSLSGSPRMNGPTEGKRENEVARLQPNPKAACPTPASGNKGKDKVEYYGVRAKHNSQIMIEAPRKIPQREAMHTRTIIHGHAGGSTGTQHPTEKQCSGIQNLLPEPPDETEWMDEGGTMGVEETNMEDQVMPAGDFLVEEGLVRETYPC